nr:immunoglobulin heavy chain junction region [Macaca mulatta]MOV52425.1 immunoglobulin heavy chain junction region [Macaca mulatta]
CARWASADFDFW